MSPSTETSGGNSTQIVHGVCIANADEVEKRKNRNSPFMGLRLFSLVFALGFPPAIGNMHTDVGRDDMLRTIPGGLGIPGGVSGVSMLVYVRAGVCR
jgi:hypothetical protein